MLNMIVIQRSMSAAENILLSQINDMDTNTDDNRRSQLLSNPLRISSKTIK